MIIGLSDTIPMFKLASATFHTCSRGDLSKVREFFFEHGCCCNLLSLDDMMVVVI